MSKLGVRLKIAPEVLPVGSHVGLSNVNRRMQAVFGDEYALMVDTAPGAGTKITPRLPKFDPAVRPSLPDYRAPRTTY